MTLIDERPLLMVTEVAERLRVAPNTLREWSRRGCGPPLIRLSGGALRYRPEDIDAWLKKRAERTAAEPKR